MRDGRREGDRGGETAGEVRDPRCRTGLAGGEAGEADLLAAAYRRSLEVAEGLGCRTVAFPALSTGIYGYPAELAAPVAVGAVRPLRDRFEEIRFVFVDDALRRLFEQQLDEL
jgi:O-acetyl-ADP-ribose deacetylase (regulator of RNase III)